MFLVVKSYYTLELFLVYRSYLIGVFIYTAMKCMKAAWVMGEYVMK